MWCGDHRWRELERTLATSSGVLTPDNEHAILIVAAAAVLQGQSVIAAVEHATNAEAAMAELRSRGQTSTPPLDGRTVQELHSLVLRAAHPVMAVEVILGRWQRIGAALDVVTKAVLDVESQRQWERMPIEAMFAVHRRAQRDDGNDDDAPVEAVVDEMVARWHRQQATRSAKPKKKQTIWDASANSTLDVAEFEKEDAVEVQWLSADRGVETAQIQAAMQRCVEQGSLVGCAIPSVRALMRCEAAPPPASSLPPSLPPRGGGSLCSWCLAGVCLARHLATGCAGASQVPASGRPSRRRRQRPEQMGRRRNGFACGSGTCSRRRWWCTLSRCADGLRAV
eukprot:COSAG01_NODE_1963_length_8785_cov_56.285402_2_plen_339_part_00